jgi:hypothetical protein
MHIQAAKTFFNLGVIHAFTVVRAPMNDGCWMITGNGKMGLFTITTALNSDKCYSSMDSVVKDIERITGRVSSFAISP